ncbi:MAG: AAA family ATPase [Mariprofundaceae bacterium]
MSYLEHWHLRDFPFENVPNQQYFFESGLHRSIHEDLLDAIMRRKGAMMLTGDIGCGKSTLIQHLLLQLPEERFDVAFITYSRLSPVEMLREINSQLGIESETADKNLLLNHLRQHLTANASSGRDIVVCIDEAQSIPSSDTLEELRLLLNYQLSNRFLITFLLVGQPELLSIVKALPQLHQRIALHLHLGALSANDTTNYLLHRLKCAGITQPMMTTQAASKVHHLSHGVPRRINHLMDRCLLTGMRNNTPLLDSKLVTKTANMYPC